VYGISNAHEQNKKIKLADSVEILRDPHFDVRELCDFQGWHELSLEDDGPVLTFAT
jgi:hypothetical protein